jgi:hypothetical protein
MEYTNSAEMKDVWEIWRKSHLNTIFCTIGQRKKNPRGLSYIDSSYLLIAIILF